MFGFSQKKRAEVSVWGKASVAWNEKLSHFEKIIASFLFGQVFAILYDLLGFEAPFSKEHDLAPEEQDSKGPILFFSLDENKNLCENEALLKFEQSIKQNMFQDD